MHSPSIETLQVVQGTCLRASRRAFDLEKKAFELYLERVTLEDEFCWKRRSAQPFVEDCHVPLRDHHGRGRWGRIMVASEVSLMSLMSLGSAVLRAQGNELLKLKNVSFHGFRLRLIEVLSVLYTSLTCSNRFVLTVTHAAVILACSLTEFVSM